MAKAKTKAAGDTRQQAIDDAKAKIAEAEAAGVAAEAEFKAAENDAAKAEAQAKINAATEMFTRYEAALEALLKPAEAGSDEEGDGPDTRDFIVASAIRHDGVDYPEGSTISLTKPQYEQIAPLGALAGPA